MKPSSEPLVFIRSPHLGDTHPKAPQWHAVNVRTLISADIEGKIIYLGPRKERVEEAYVLKAAA
ncbi:MAG: hypothetical protein IAE77_08200 [Prosthecobacter sp.]|jgi:hypothetical protein|uniref:hypothetical protein n=1 Tax=Prosthecobacter sp. TaxID=1965333 RepID=UPI0019FF011A|nr:hypothetical protein [Prosthecobacter sp.]MBE2283429.1 hypothetical protein [Prosthecobacter sp.]